MDDISKDDFLKALGFENDQEDATWYNLAKITFGMYDNFIKVGFTPAQAIELVKTLIMTSTRR